MEARRGIGPWTRTTKSWRKREVRECIREQADGRRYAREGFVTPRAAKRHVWDRSVPKSVREVFLPLVERYAFMLPGWCRKLTLSYEDDCGDPQVLAMTQAQYEYRDALIAFTPRLVGEDLDTQEGTVVHELAHVLLWPIMDMGQKLLHLIDDPKAQQIMSDQFRQAVEASTEDVARAFLTCRSRKPEVPSVPAVPAGSGREGQARRRKPSV
jgi:hypothetical protein